MQTDTADFALLILFLFAALQADVVFLGHHVS